MKLLDEKNDVHEKSHSQEKYLTSDGREKLIIYMDESCIFFVPYCGKIIDWHDPKGLHCPVSGERLDMIHAGGENVFVESQ
jgi:hypothetical protein